MAGSLKEAHIDVLHAFKRFFKDIRRLFTASKRTFFLLIVVEVILGLAAIFALILLAQTVDAVIGARAIRVVTSDVSRVITQQIVLFVVLFPVLIIHHQWSGLAASIAQRIRNAIFLSGMFVMALPIAPLLLPVIGVAAWLVTYAQSRWVHILFSSVATAYAAWSFYRLVTLAVYQSVTVGDVFLIGGSLMAFVGFLAIRPYLSPGDHKGSPLRE